MARWESNGLADTIARLQRLATADATPLMERWERIIVEDNTRKVMASQDWRGAPLKPVTYRPLHPKPLTARQRNHQTLRDIDRGDGTTGFGPLASGLHGNLTYSEYVRLTGPPTAPRGKHSRVITNLLTMHGRDPGALHRWFAMGAWADVVDVEGNPFLDRLFATRDLRGVTPTGMAQAQRAMDAWARTLF